MNPRHTWRVGQPPPATLAVSLDCVAMTAHRVVRLRCDSRTYRGCASFPETLNPTDCALVPSRGCPTRCSAASAQHGCRLHTVLPIKVVVSSLLSRFGRPRRHDPGIW